MPTNHWMLTATAVLPLIACTVTTSSAPDTTTPEPADGKPAEPADGKPAEPQPPTGGETPAASAELVATDSDAGQLGDPCNGPQACAEGLACSGLFLNTAGECVSVETAAEQCAEQGGEWGSWGMAQVTYCMRVHPDAGKACTDGDACAGACIATKEDPSKGTCQRYETQYGCYTTLEDGQEARSLCVD